MNVIARTVVAVIALSAVAYGDGTKTSAREHYERGSTLFDLGRFAEAAREFEAAYEAKNDAALLFNIGQAYRADGNYAKALVAYKAFLRRSDDQTRRPDVEARITELQRLIEEQKAANTRPPTGTVAPADKPSAAEAARPEHTTAARPELVATTAPAGERTAVYKKWWLWTIVGVAAAGAATGVALALTLPKDAAIPPGATTVGFH